MNPIWLHLAAAAAATYGWRFLGVLASRRISVESPLILWIRAVATALIAALVVRFVYAPSGLLAQTAFLSRAVALPAAVISYFAFGRRIEAGVAAGAGIFALLEMLG